MKRALILLLLLSACGVQGKLYLPDHPKPKAPERNPSQIIHNDLDRWSGEMQDLK